MECDELLSCNLKTYESFSGMTLGLDQFIVNSFMFIPNEHVFVVSVDNFGLLVFDVARRELVDNIPFNSLFSNFPSRFIIFNIIPIGSKGMRILMRQMGSFSIFWDRIIKIGDGSNIFENFKVANRLGNVENQISSNNVDFNANGFVQIIYVFRKGGLYDGFLRVYNHMNRDNSKAFMDYPMGRVLPCIFVDYYFTEGRIVAICGARLYIFEIYHYPSLRISSESNNLTLDIKIIAENNYSNHTINLFAININNSDTSRWIMFGIFIATVLSASIGTYLCCIAFMSKGVAENMKKVIEDKSDTLSNL